MENVLHYYDSRRNKGCESMNSVQVRNIKIGAGKPKICIPIVGETKEQILMAVKNAVSMPIDFIEWRADWYDEILEFDKLEVILGELREILADMPLLFTFRTQKEGGNLMVSDEAYIAMCKKVCDTGLADMIDVEMFSGKDVIEEIISYAHQKNIFVVGSNHDFGGTPGKKELVTRLQIMQHFKADIIKIAVMPQNKEDVLALLLATEEMVSKHAKVPVISMSMSKLGVLSRISGEFFGSAVTFASMGTASAPGQIPVEAMRMIIDTISSCED